MTDGKDKVHDDISAGQVEADSTVSESIMKSRVVSFWNFLQIRIGLLHVINTDHRNQCFIVPESQAVS